MTTNNIRVSSFVIDERLFECQKLVNRYESDRERMYGGWALSALSGYVATGRASADWLRAFLKAKPAALMRTATKHGNSDYDCIRAVNKYLARYYGYVQT